jgi:DNA polymerase III alpha subunit (gram-positive type)
MAQLVASDPDAAPDVEFVVYDLEMVGNIHTPAHCHIWDIAAMRFSNQQKRFMSTVMPDMRGPLPGPAHPDLVHVTKESLQGAQQWDVVGLAFLEWLEAQRSTTNTQIVLVSHGNYLFDKPMIEIEYGRRGVSIPNYVTFMDTLPLMRSIFRKQPAYTLKSLYIHMFGVGIRDQHTAEADATALVRMLRHTETTVNRKLANIETVYYPAYYTPLTTVNGIGAYNERLLVRGGMQSVEFLKLAYVSECRMDTVAMQTLLHRKYHMSRASSVIIAERARTMTLHAHT